MNTNIRATAVWSLFAGYPADKLVFSRDSFI